MLSWFRKFKESDRDTKVFFFVAFIYMASVAFPVAYCYMRLF